MKKVGEILANVMSDKDAEETLGFSIWTFLTYHFRPATVTYWSAHRVGGVLWLQPKWKPERVQT